MNTIKDTGSYWKLVCQPHVAMRIKRLFPSARARQGEIVLSKTTEHAFDLDWFFIRFPFEGDTDSVYALSKEYSERKEKVDAVLKGERKVRKFDLKIPLRDYQKVAAELGLTMGRVLIADEVGLGKSAEAIAMLAGGAPLPALVVTLTHLTNQWRREIEKFAPQLNPHVIKTGKNYDLTKHRGKTVPEPDVIIINYTKLAKWASALEGKVKTLIFDEGQELRRHGSKKYDAAQVLRDKSEIRCCLSATPIFNYGEEFYNVFDILDPDALGTREEFLGEWCLRSMREGKSKIRDPEAFGSYLRSEGMMLRRTRSDVGREIEDLSKIPVEIEADTKEIDKVKGTARELAQTVLSRGGLKRGEKMMAAEELSTLMRQVTGVAKAPHVADFVRNLVDSGESVVLYGWHHSCYDLWMSKLQDLNPVLYTGKQTAAAKDKSAQAFLNGDSKVLIMSLRAGAGLDGLQEVCRTVVFGELDWSPSIHHQNIGRIHRDGQKHPVAAYYLITDGGIDPIMADVLGVKTGQLNPVLDPNVLNGRRDTGDTTEKLAEYVLHS